MTAYPINDPSLPLQKIIVAALKAGVSGVNQRVYDAVPTTPTFPYVSLGNVQVISENFECLQGAEVHLTIDVWSRAVGKVECKQISAAIISTLDDSDLSNGTLTINNILLKDVLYLDDPDGLTSHGVLNFRALTD